MSAPMSPADQRAELNWLKYREEKDLWNSLKDDGPHREAAWKSMSAFEHVLQADLATSVYALASVLMIEIEDNESDEDVPGVWRASLAAIRPRLTGVIAEAADRVQAQEEEAE